MFYILWRVPKSLGVFPVFHLTIEHAAVFFLKDKNFITHHYNNNQDTSDFLHQDFNLNLLKVMWNKAGSTNRHNRQYSQKNQR